MINPYANLNLENSERILSVSHQHLVHTNAETDDQPMFNTIYNSGVRHFAFSRYRPSINTYPFDYENNTFVYVGNPLTSTMPLEQLKTQYAITIDANNDSVGCPSAEHIRPNLYINDKWATWTCVHINSLGSTYESGLIPSSDPKTGYRASGLEMPYSDAITNMLNDLQYSDGGGVIINHPKWTDNEIKKAVSRGATGFDLTRFIMDCLDYDGRVLGTDILESGEKTSVQFDSEVIDTILSTGRRCWIFCQSDWNKYHGRNELIIPSGLSRTEKEHACLQAYRNGAFFGRYANTRLSITSIGYSNGFFSMTADNADGIEVTVDGQTTDYTGTSVSVSVPETAKYVRAMAYTKDGDEYTDMVFTNPIMINETRYDYNPAYDDVPDPVVTGHKNRLWLWG